MSRNIVLLSDGTGNSAAKVWRTNVWRTFEALDLSGNDQVAFYDDGVGTSSFKPWAILGGAFGFGLKRNVVDIYKFACRNYRDDTDRIYGFGFSRGAFTIRVVIGLILNQSLVSADNEAELDKKAIAAYRQYRSERYHTMWPWHPENWYRAIRNFLLPIKYDKADNRQVKHIRFIGVWDTVAAYGLPMDEMTRGVSRWVVPLELPNHTLDRERVMRACQALSLDEERTTFHPILWNETSVAPSVFDPDKKRYVADKQLSQVWFAGVHSDIGGGYPETQSGLSKYPLLWMIEEAVKCGLAVNRATVNQLAWGRQRLGSPFSYVAPDVMGERHDSMTIGWRALEYLPKADKYREWPAKKETQQKWPERRSFLGHYIPDAEPRVIPEGALIHGSAIEKIARDPRYRPVNMPTTYQAVPMPVEPVAAVADDRDEDDG